MSEYLNRARDLQKNIKYILLHEWDPIGVSTIDEADDEYDAYVSEVYQILIHRKPPHDLFDYLWWVETEHMELTGNRQKTLAITSKLIDMYKNNND